MDISIVKGLSFPLRVGNKGGFVTSTELTHIEESMIQILSTQIGERVMNPNFGSSIDSQIFQNGDSSSFALIKFEIVEALTNNEPRIVLDEDNIILYQEDDTIIVEVPYTLKEYTNMGFETAKIKIES